LVSSLAFSGILGILVLWLTLGTPDAPLAAAPPATPDTPHREISGDTDSPNISFIDSPSATCYRPVAETGACYIRWDYLSVTAASSSYIISMSVTIDNHLRAYHTGFFQTSMYIPDDMVSPGFKVTCGAPGSGGDSAWGNSYSYVIRARETSGLSAANYGTVRCPADLPKAFLPWVVH